MIIINVLPPEYRRRDIGVNPITLSIGGAALVNFFILLIWAYIAFLSIPHAETIKERLTNDRATAEKKAKEVDEVVKQIEEQLQVRKVLVDLLNKKVYWAKTINDFVTVLTDPSNRLNTGGFEVSIESFSIAEAKTEGVAARGKKKSVTPTGRTFDVTWTPQIMSTNAMKMNANIRTFFDVFEQSEFWTEHSFSDQPDKTYPGARVEVKDELGRSVAMFPLVWKRYVPLKNSDNLVAKKGAAK